MRKKTTQLIKLHVKEWNQIIKNQTKKRMRWGLHDESSHEVLLELSVCHERSPPR